MNYRNTIAGWNLHSEMIMEIVPVTPEDAVKLRDLINDKCLVDWSDADTADIQMAIAIIVTR